MMLQLHGLVVTVLVLVVGWLMLQAGLAKKALELRHPPRACPSCGRPSTACRCVGRA
ncbi:MAG TPA: hypothetical protein VFA88_11040 [Gaiellaceae bacterium]|nr:hypothetical protein [Gaiellaceae bacterium]